MNTATAQRFLDALDHFIEAEIERHPALWSIRDRCRREVAAVFLKQGEIFLSLFATARGHFKEVAIPFGWERFFAEASAETLAMFVVAIRQAAEDSLLAGMARGTAQFKPETAFNLSNPRAVAYLREHGAELVTKINETTRERLRTLIADGTEQGWSYSKMATAIRNEFVGFAGLKPQLHIQNRAELVAVTETGNAFEEGNLIVSQTLEDAGIEQEKYWLTVGDNRVSDLCRGNQGRGWIPTKQAFPSGHMRPLGHPACVLGETLINAHGILAATKRWYDGDFVVVNTASGKQLICTPNHPILTPRGWIPAGLLNKGGYVISVGASKRRTASLNLDGYDMPARIEDITEAFRGSEQMTAVPVPTSAKDFHGDGVGSEVAVIWADSLLGDRFYATGGEHLPKYGLSRRDATTIMFSANSHHRTLLSSPLTAPLGSMRRFTIPSVFLRCASLHHEAIGNQGIAYRDTGFPETANDGGSADTKTIGNGMSRFSRHISGDDVLDGQALGTPRGRSRPIAVPSNSRLMEAMQDSGDVNFMPLRYFSHRLACPIFPDKVVNVDHFSGAAHVFNLQTKIGCYGANGIITHNCRCVALYRSKPQEATTTDIGGSPAIAAPRKALGPYEEAVTAFANKYSNQKVEYLQLLGKGDTMIADISKGTQVRSKYSEAQLAAIRLRQVETMLHNHPSGGAVWGGDVKAAASAKARRVVAITEGDVFSLTADNGWGNTARAKRIWMQAFRRLIYNKELTYIEQTHLSTAEMAKYMGYVYKRWARIGGVIKW